MAVGGLSSGLWSFANPFCSWTFINPDSRGVQSAEKRLELVWDCTGEREGEKGPEAESLPKTIFIVDLG